MNETRTIASAAKPGAAGRHERNEDDRKRGEAGRGGAAGKKRGRTQGRGSRARRVVMNETRTIASAAKPGAAGRHERNEDDRKRGEAGRGGAALTKKRGA